MLIDKISESYIEMPNYLLLPHTCLICGKLMSYEEKDNVICFDCEFEEEGGSY